MKKSIIFLLCSLFFMMACSETDVVPDKSFKRAYYHVNHVEYRTGNCPIILTVPHGGTYEDATLVKRTESNCPDPEFATVRDANTIELALLIESAFVEKTGKYPYMIIGKVSRTCIDFNRQKSYAIPADAPNNEAIYDTFHAYTSMAKEAVGKEFGDGLLCDIHGQGHTKKQVEIGYLLKAAELDLTDEQLMANDEYARKSSIYNLVVTNKSMSSFTDLLRGPYSIGSLMYKNGLACVPHSENPTPGSLPYFNGGYITKTYGSSEGAGPINALQFEFDSVSRESDKNRQKTAIAFVESVVEYVNKHYRDIVL